MRYKNKYNYDLTAYQCRCPVCGRQSKNNKCLADHIFHGNHKDQRHREFAESLRKDAEARFLQRAKKCCPTCGMLATRNLANHFRLLGDTPHTDFLEQQTAIILSLFQDRHSPNDIIKCIPFMNVRWVRKILVRRLGKENVEEISRQIFSRKRKRYWASVPVEERKQMMKGVYKAGWRNLTPEERKSHPWVLAGRKASLESALRGSRNQQYAFELLRKRLPEYDWKYNYTIDENWQIDIAAPERGIFIEWDGRHHRFPIHGAEYLNNRRNRDTIKDKIVVEQLRGTIIRVVDDGKFDGKFVEIKVDRIFQVLGDDTREKIIRIV